MVDLIHLLVTKNIEEVSHKMILNKCQIKTTQEAVDWFNRSSEQIFEIDGEAGDRKSVV